jgi:hypothetical protein
VISFVALGANFIARREEKQILRAVYPERTAEILRSAQNDKRRAQDDMSF